MLRRVKTNFTTYDARPWQKSYAEGVPNELPDNGYDSIHEMVSKSSKDRPDWPAISICFQDGTTSSLDFQTLDKYANQFAGWLRFGMKLHKGDRVAIQMPNCIAYPIVMLGIWKAGGVVVNVNPQSSAKEMKHQFADSGAKILVVADVLGKSVAGSLEDGGIEKVVMAGVTDFVGRLDRARLSAKMWAVGARPPKGFEHSKLGDVLVEGERLMQGQPWIDNTHPGDLAVLQYTGGTTGVSKGAMLSHGNLIANVEQGRAMLKGAGAMKTSVYLTALPLYHAFAFGIMLSGIVNGAHNVLIPNPRPVVYLRKAFEQFDVNVFTAVNTLLVKLLEEDWFVTNPPENLETTLAGGTALLDTVAQTWIRVVGQEPYQAYGLTEASPGICMNPPGGIVKRGTVGVPLPGTEVRLVDAEGEPAEQGERGELVVRGPQVMQGYWGDRSNDTITDGWFRTGDIATMDKDGYFSIVDRIKDVILVNGFNVYPNEVEDVLSKHPDVRECGVVGLSDPSTGEKVVAFVVPRTDSLTDDAVIAFSRQLLTAYKVPADVVFIEELPYSAVGKVLRRKLRGRYGLGDYVRRS